MEEVGFPRGAGPLLHLGYFLLTFVHHHEETLNSLIIKLLNKLICLEQEGRGAISDCQKSRLRTFTTSSSVHRLSQCESLCHVGESLFLHHAFKRTLHLGKIRRN